MKFFSKQEQSSSIVSQIPKERKNFPVDSPACNLAEPLFNIYLAKVLKHQRDLDSRKIDVVTESGRIVSVDVITKAGERNTSLVISSPNGQLDGMILAPPDMGYKLLRPVLHTINNEGGGVFDAFERALEGTGVTFDNREGNNSRFLVEILLRIGVVVGDQLSRNARDFSDYLSKLKSSRNKNL